MRSVFISAGHSAITGIKRDNGAAGNGYVEGVLAAEFRQLLSKELRNLGITPTIDKEDSILADTISFLKNKTAKDSIVVDIHFNAGTPQATGTEVLIPTEHTKFEKDLATEVSRSIANTLLIKDRGVKTEADSHHGRLGFMRLTGENILLELCFISNKKDIESYQENKIELAKNLAKIIHKYATLNASERIYVVQKGDTLSKIAIVYNTTIIKIKKDNNLQTDALKIGQKIKL